MPSLSQPLASSSQPSLPSLSQPLAPSSQPSLPSLSQPLAPSSQPSLPSLSQPLAPSSQPSLPSSTTLPVPSVSSPPSWPQPAPWVPSVAAAAPTPPSGVHFSLPVPAPVTGASSEANRTTADARSLRSGYVLLAAAVLSTVLVAGAIFATRPRLQPIGAGRSSLAAEHPEGDPVDPIASASTAVVEAPELRVVNEGPVPSAASSGAPSSSAASSSAPSARVQSQAPPQKGYLKRYPSPDPVGTSFY